MLRRSGQLSFIPSVNDKNMQRERFVKVGILCIFN